MADAEVPFVAISPGVGEDGSVAVDRLAVLRSRKVAFGAILALGACAAWACLVNRTRTEQATALMASRRHAGTTASSKVQVQIYGMAGCPFTRGFLEGPVVEVMDTVPELVDLEFVPFGNSYYHTEACGGSADGMPYASYNQGYDADVRQCWNRICGSDAAEPASDCFAGELICQHGTTDGMVTSAWACAKALSHDASSSYIPFFQCTASKFLRVTSQSLYEAVVRDCAGSTGFDAEHILTCAASRGTLNAQGRLTPMHSGVPYALIDGEVLDDTGCVACGDGIIQKVCERSRARGAPKNDVCEGIFR